MIEHKHKGAASELKACAWLLEQGYEVFRNVSQFGSADVIAVTPTGDHILIDVKTSYRYTRKDGSTRNHYGGSKSDGVKILCVFPEEDECSWVD